MKTNKIRQVQSIKTRLDKQDRSMTRQKAANINKNGNIVRTQFFALKMFNWLRVYLLLLRESLKDVYTSCKRYHVVMLKSS